MKSLYINLPNNYLKKKEKNYGFRVGDWVQFVVLLISK